MPGKLIVISAPSGAGKTSIVKAVLQAGLGLEFSVSACSRPSRANEVNGMDYYFLTVDEFRQKIRNQEFIEWEEVYKDHYYGTLRSEVERITSMGRHVIFDVDVMGGLSIKRIYKEKALVLFIMPPSFEALEKRLRNRLTESEEELMMRLDKARKELTYAGQFDRIIVNDDLERAIAETITTIREFAQTTAQP